MTYLQAYKRPYQRLRQTIAGTIVAFIVLVIVVQIFAPHFFSSIFTAIVRPFWRLEFSIENGLLKSPEVLLGENEELRRQLADIQVRLDTIHHIELENDELKNLFGRKSDISVSLSVSNSSTTPNQSESINNNQNYILSAVLKRPPFSPYDELVIDIGSDHDISTSSLVYFSGNVLIGRVVDVLKTTSRVKLFSSPGEKFEVLIGASNIPATAVGRGGGQYEAQVSRDTTVKEGDFVINSSLSNKPFGVVSAVLFDPTQPFETILFAPPVNMYQLRWVLIK